MSFNTQIISTFPGGSGGGGGGSLPAAGATLSLAPGAPGNFTVAHGLAKTPKLVSIEVKPPGGGIYFQATPYDATNLYLVATDGSVVGTALVWV